MKLIQLLFKESSMTHWGIRQKQKKKLILNLMYKVISRICDIAH